MRFLPGIILAVVGVGGYVIGCMIFLEQRRQKARGTPNRTLFVYSIAMMLLGMLALGAGLLALEMTQFHAVSG
ncbi:MAG TPA: hypothetical protein VH206_08015 [Xanthobacteraceae bacterium]|nr:hypothetical protein [Xanthobacteraceae bacterium]